MKVFYENDKFILREIVLADADGMFEMDSDPEVHKYLGNKPVTTKEQVVDVIKMIRQQYVDNGIGRWAIINKSTHEFMGWTGLKLVTTEINGHKNYLDVGYRLNKRFWGQGIATETAIISLRYAFDKLNANEVFGMADVENIASNKVLSKIGMQFVNTFYYEGVIKHNWYRIDKQAFTALST